MPGPDVTKNYVRHRQISPKKCAKKSFRTIKRGKTTLVVCCPKGEFHNGRCDVGMRAQSILKPHKRRKKRGAR